MAYIFKTKAHYTDLIKECIVKLDALNVPISKDILFKTNTGFSRFGFCKKTPRGETAFVIAINKWFEDDLGLIETIMHELVHTVDGCYNHGAKFHKIAEMINQEYNLNITVVGHYKLNEKAYKCAAVKKGTGYELCWGLSSYGTREFNVSYDMTNLVKGCSDGSFIDQTFINNLPSSLKTAKITIEKKYALCVFSQLHYLKI